jgi:hypothetical protein
VRGGGLRSAVIVRGVSSIPAGDKRSGKSQVEIERAVRWWEKRRACAQGLAPATHGAWRGGSGARRRGGPRLRFSRSPAACARGRRPRSEPPGGPAAPPPRPGPYHPRPSRAPPHPPPRRPSTYRRTHARQGPGGSAAGCCGIRGPGDEADWGGGRSEVRPGGSRLRSTGRFLSEEISEEVSRWRRDATVRMIFNDVLLFAADTSAYLSASTFVYLSLTRFSRSFHLQFRRSFGTSLHRLAPVLI